MTFRDTPQGDIYIRLVLEGDDAEFLPGLACMSSALLVDPIGEPVTLSDLIYGAGLHLCDQPESELKALVRQLNMILLPINDMIAIARSQRQSQRLPRQCHSLIGNALSERMR
jgi:hypothetical protein